MRIKLYIIISILFLLNQLTFGQDVKYSGGDGDGYSSSVAFDDNPPSALSGSSRTKGVLLTLTQNNYANDVIILYNTSNSFGTPTDGVSYKEGDNISGGGTVLFYGSGTITNSGLAEETTYYFKAWSFANGTYSTSALSVNYSTLSAAQSVPASFSAASPTQFREIDLSWTQNSTGEDVILAYNTTNTFGTPTDGVAYSNGGAISGGGTVLYSGSNTSYTHNQLNDAATYYYKIWTINNDYYSNSGLTTNETTIADPVNPTGISVVSNGLYSITIEWTQNSNSEDVLLAYNTSNSFGTPTDGGTYSASDGISGGGTVLYNGSNTSYAHSSLNTETTYYYKLWSVTSGNYYSVGDGDNATTISDANAALYKFDGGDGGGSASAESGNSPLPVELAAFEGYNTEDGVVLIWETATETNNYGFQVQRKMIKDKSESEWVDIGFLQGHGTTNSPKSYSFTDTDLPDTTTVSYRIKQIDNDGTFAYSKTVDVDLTTITGVEKEEIPIVYSLSQNYPNPFNPTTTIKFGLPEQGFVDLRVYNILGQEVARLANQEMNAGYHEVNFGTGNIASGMYIYRIDVKGKFSSVKKMILIK